MSAVRALHKFLFVALFILPVISFAQDPSAVGQWTAPKATTARTVHGHLLPDGKVFYFSYYDESLQPHIWDPATATDSNAASINYRLFCSGHSFLPNGDLLVTSGHEADYVGYKYASIYHPFTNTWTTGLPLMNAGRWYPTNTTLPSGDILVTSGQIDTTVGNNPLPQVWQASTSSWRDLTSAQLKLPLYPMMFVAPNGKVFNAGPSQYTRYLDTSGAGAWTGVGNSNFGYRTYGSAVLYDYGKILLLGGGDPPTATAEIIDLNAATPAWKYTAPMSSARRQQNATILADGTVLVTGGSSGTGFDNNSAPVYKTELWDPATGTWTAMAPITVYRGYHSMALLLPDGRVLSGGGNYGGACVEIFSPPYLFKGTRPTIDSAPAEIAYGSTFAIGSAAAASIGKVHLIRLSSVTHSFNQEQRIARLQFSIGSGVVDAIAPANPNLAPPGYYMLFIVDSTGVPSEAKIVHLSGTAATATGAVQGFVKDQNGGAIAAASVSASTGGTATTAADGSYTLSGVAAGSVTLSASAAGFASASETVQVTSGATTSAPDLVLAVASGPGAFHGKVTNQATGAALSGTTVSYSGGSTTTDASGNYSFANVSAGTYSVTATHSGYLAKTSTVTVTAGTDTQFDIQLSTAGQLTGTVKHSDGTVAVGVSVEIRSGDLSTVITKTTNSSGVYGSGWIPIGNYTVTASQSGYNDAQTTATVTTGATTTAALLTLTPSGGPTTLPGSISGKVTNARKGAALSGATVSGTLGTKTTDTSGNYSFTNVAAGTYTLTASRSGYLARSFTITVASGAAVIQNMPIATSGVLSGKVTNTSGGAMSGVTVHVVGGVVATDITKTTDANGNFNAGWIPVGTYTVTFAKTGLTSQTKSATVTAGVTTSVNVVMQ